MGRKAGVSIQTTIYSTFRGADFSTDPSLVERYRSPLCTNIIADEGGMPEKRPGWRALHDFEETINGLHRGVFNGTEKLLVHAGTSLYEYDEATETATQKLTGLANAKSRAVFLVGKLWILDGKAMISYDGTNAVKVTSGECYVPTVLIGREPTGGGETYEQVNMATPLRQEEFRADGTTKTFKVQSSRDANSAVRAWVYDTAQADWIEKTSGTDFTVSGQNVTFTTAPPAPAAGERDMVRIRYSHTVTGYADRINKCRFAAAYGINGTNRICISGNPDYQNQDYTCAINDPTYWPDMGYGVIGSDRTAIKGYLRIGAYLAIVKEDDGSESTVYFRRGSLSESGEVTYSTEPALAGVGAVSSGSFCELLDDPLFLSGTGVQAVSMSDVNGSRVTQNRSFFVNPKLRKEEGMSEAEAVVWNGMYLLALPSGDCYVMDGRQEKSYRSAALSDFVYECYYWENIPARVWLKKETDSGEELYFGTEDGRLCRFSTDDPTVNRFADDGEAISAVWATRYDDDGSPSYLKTLLKSGCCVTIKPMSRSSGTVFFRTDRSEGTEQLAASATMDIFSFEDVDFERFTFNTDDSPQEIFFRKKVKNYKRLQIIIRNAEPAEGFGVYQITKHFVVGNFAKHSGAAAKEVHEDNEATLEETMAAMQDAYDAVFGG